MLFRSAADLASESRSSWLQLGSWVGAQEWGSRLSTGVLGRWGLTASWCEVELLRGERGGRAARLQDWTREATIWSTRVPYRSLSSFWLGAERSRSFGGLVGGARARVRQGPRAQPTRSGSEGSIPDRSPRLTNKGTGGCSPWLDGEYAGSPQVSLEGAQGRPWVWRVDHTPVMGAEVDAADSPDASFIYIAPQLGGWTAKLKSSREC